MEELVGTYTHTRYRDEEQDFLVGFLESGDTVTGPANPLPEPGMTYRFFGSWKISPKYGKQFRFVVYTSHEPHSRQAVCLYLEKMCKGTGLGKVAAMKLWDKYQSEAVAVLRIQPKRAAEECGLDWEKCQEASDRLAKNARREHTMVELVGLFSGRGFPAGTISACMERWGSRAPGLIGRDPFLLLTHRIPGAGFARCDSLYQSQGHDLGRMKRQVICGWHHIDTRSSGDTWHPVKEAIEEIKQKIDSVDAQPVKAIKIGARAQWLKLRRDTDGELWISDGDNAKAELTVARVVATMAASGRCDWPRVDDPSLTDHQREQITAATAGPVGVLSGTPGTGKTFTAAGLIRAIIARHGSGVVGVLAPTGKASVRMTESLAKAGIGGLKAMTIHRALLPSQSGHGTGKWGFTHNAENPLGYRFVIVDETSMVDTSLMSSLVSALSVGAHLLLIGDPYQLPPVGHGAPFRDLIEAGLPRGHLTEIKRNAGLIVDTCRAIREGAAVQSCEMFDDNGNNLRFVLSGSPVQTIDVIKRVFEAVKAKGSRDPIEDLQVLVPMNEHGSLGRTKLNTMLQGILNANGQAADGNKFRVGDKVICLGNGWYPSLIDPRLPEYLANGDIGRVIGVGSFVAVMEFPSVGDGPRCVRIPIKTEYGDKFDLAYAITCHKSQGSEWPVVIILADESASRVASREWWYTAVSRAKDRCLIIGRKAIMEKQARKALLDKRKTFLVELVTEERERLCKETEGESGNEAILTSESVPLSSPSTPESNTHLASTE